MSLESHNHFATETASVTDLRCDGTDTRCGSEEVANSHHVVFIRRGAYHNFRDRQRILADSREVLFYNVGETYRVSHPNGGDDCTVLTFAPAAIADVFAGIDARNQWRPEQPFPFSHGPAEPGAVLACHLLRHRIPATGSRHRWRSRKPPWASWRR